MLRANLAAAVAKLPALTGKATGTAAMTRTDEIVDAKFDTQVDTRRADFERNIRTYKDAGKAGKAPLGNKSTSQKPLCRSEKSLEAATRIELVNDGFANHCLTAWLRRLFYGLTRREKRRKYYPNLWLGQGK